MALVNCSECNNQISDKAVACPHCGSPLRGATAVRSKNIKKYSIIISALIVIACAILLSIFKNSDIKFELDCKRNSPESAAKCFVYSLQTNDFENATSLMPKYIIEHLTNPDQVQEFRNSLLAASDVTKNCEGIKDLIVNIDSIGDLRKGSVRTLYFGNCAEEATTITLFKEDGKWKIMPE